MLTTAENIKIGQRIVLDMGYGGHSMDEVCTVTHYQLPESLTYR